MLVEAFPPREGVHEYTVANAVGHLTDRVMGLARYPAQSTSPTSNLMEQYEAAAFAEALDELKYISE
jgi:predicted DNA-binding protein with PD1-like motif